MVNSSERKVRNTPQGDYDGRRLCTGSYEGDNEEEDKEGYECSTGALTLAGESIAILVQICLHDDHL